MLQDVLTKIGVDLDVSFNFIFLTLIWVRVLAMGVTIPFLLGKPVPRYVLVGATMVMAVFVHVNIVPDSPPPLELNLLALIVLYMKEVFYGLAIGFAVGILFHGIESAGQMVDNQRGVSIARILIPQLDSQGSISGNFLFQLALVLYLTVGGHLIFFNSFFTSFITLPILEFPTSGPGLFALIDFFMKITGEVIVISIKLAAPVIIAIFLADIILGIANRVSPQIDVWMMGFTVKGYLGIIMVFLSITIICDQIIEYSQKANNNADKAVLFLENKVPIPTIPMPAPEEGLPKPEMGPPQVVTP
ncbi:MAG: flagellar biosynthetic protein FliR [Pseudomonadota bacterium]